jgi:cytidylate kinase
VVRDALTQRDRADASLGRALRAEDAAPDAMVVDTTSSTVDEVVAAIVARVRAAEQAADRAAGEGTP